MRTLSSQALQALYAQETATAFHLLITISHPTLAQPFTLTSDSIPTVSNGVTFNPFPFEISLPDDDPEKIPEAKLTIDAVDLSIIDAVRGFGTVPATITIQVVTSVTPSVVELEVGPLTLRDVTYDALTVQGAMRFEEILNEPFPGDLVSPATIPGVFLLT
ncbi:DUF1833 family protein [bacterium]|jgi:hypothetical protein|nr:DUF1833 family protein [bacterium]